MESKPEMRKYAKGLRKAIAALLATAAFALGIMTSAYAGTRKTVDVVVGGKIYTVTLYGDATTAEAIRKAEVSISGGDVISLDLNEVVSAHDAIYIMSDPPEGLSGGLGISYYEGLSNQVEGFYKEVVPVEEVAAPPPETLKEAGRAAKLAAEALRAEVNAAKASAGVPTGEEQEPVEVLSEEPGEVSEEADADSEKSLGKLISVTATAYCNCSKCCGSNAGGKTASGTTPKANRTIAASSAYSFGTKVYIPYFKDKSNGGVFVVEDRGGAIKGNKIDIYFATHKQASDFGRRTLEMYVVQD
jgi:3D (Asp-Asp-Asp) domain-containing protein